ncbi:methyltransferase domain-containing protein [Paenibacillus macerans]|uniref:class I SAM-dependent methyltransferase n=1 Tax=Paenibacillus macerans TaxID=44252 RepID=UPI003D314117
METVIQYYDNYDESARLTTDNARKLEFMTTTHILDKYITGGADILDLGAGGGIYTFYYADKGNKVVSTDITPKHVEAIQCKADLHRYPNITTHILNAVDLSRFDAERFDVVLCLGPMYHLMDPRDRDACLSECLRVLKPGGILAVAYINKYFTVPYLIKSDRRYLDEEWISHVIEQGRSVPTETDAFLKLAQFLAPDEIEGLLEPYGVAKLDHAATDGIGIFMRETINQLSEEEYGLWVKYHLATCSEPSLLGASNHGLYVCRK